MLESNTIATDKDFYTDGFGIVLQKLGNDFKVAWKGVSAPL